MRYFAKRRSGSAQIGRLAVKTVGVLVLLAITVTAVRAAWDMYGKFAEAAQSDERAQKELAAMQAQQQQMAASVDSFATGRGVEAQMRERYGVAKPGEGQIQIVRDASTTTPQPLQSPNIFIRLWHAFFGWL